MDFVIELPIFTNWKDETYDLILVIINQLTKMVNYKLVNITINAFNLAKVIFNV